MVADLVQLSEGHSSYSKYAYKRTGHGRKRMLTGEINHLYYGPSYVLRSLLLRWLRHLIRVADRSFLYHLLLGKASHPSGNSNQLCALSVQICLSSLNQLVSSNVPGLIATISGSRSTSP